MPDPGTVPGLTLEYIKDLITYAHPSAALRLPQSEPPGKVMTGQQSATPVTAALHCRKTYRPIPSLYAVYDTPSDVWLAPSTADHIAKPQKKPLSSDKFA